MEKEDFSINHTVKAIPRPLRGIPYHGIKQAILGKNYELSLVFVGSSLSRKLNKERRGRDKPANVLSFPLSKDSGEIFIDVRQARREHKKFGETFNQFVLRLFIHGLLHLKGMEHGDTMEKAENKFLKKFIL